MGALRSFVNLFLNDEDVRHLEKDGTRLSSGDTLSIIPSIAGGTAGGVSTFEKAPEVAELPDLSPGEIRHYSRHLIIPEVGSAGQKKLKAAKVLMIGAGGLGSPLGLYLAAAGVGTLGMVDFDVVDESNLQRQVLFGRPTSAGRRSQAAAERLRDINPHIEIVPHETRLDSSNALELFKDYDIVVDGTDNFPTRYLVNDACVMLGKPNVYGSIFRFEGQVSVFWGARGPVLPLPLPGAAAAGAGAQLRGGRRARRAAGHHRLASGQRGDQADPGRGRPADRPAGALRRPEDEVPRAEAPEEPELPDLLGEPHADGADRLPAVLRDRPSGGPGGSTLSKCPFPSSSSGSTKAGR